MYFFFLLTTDGKGQIANTPMISFGEGLKELGIPFGSNTNACPQAGGEKEYLFNAMRLESFPPEETWVVCDDLAAAQNVIFTIKRLGYKFMYINMEPLIKRQQSNYLIWSMYADAIFINNLEQGLKKNLKDIPHIFPFGWYLTETQLRMGADDEVVNEKPLRVGREDLVLFPHAKFDTTVQLMNDFYVMNIEKLRKRGTWKFKEYDEMIDEVPKGYDGGHFEVSVSEEERSKGILSERLDHNFFRLAKRSRICDATSGYLKSGTGQVINPDSQLAPMALAAGALPVFSGMKGYLTETKWKHGKNCWMVNMGEVMDGVRAVDIMNRLVACAEATKPDELRGVARELFGPKACAEYVISCLGSF